MIRGTIRYDTGPKTCTFSSDGVAEAAQMISADAPRHTELRALASRAFTPKRVATFERRVRDVCPSSSRRS